MSLVDKMMFWIVCRPALGRFVTRLHIPKEWKSRFVIWQFTVCANLAIKQIRDSAKAEMKA